MHTFYNIVVSDGAIALHFLLTVVLLGTLIVHGVHSGLRLDRSLRENADLKRQLLELSDYTSSSLDDVYRQIDVHRKVVQHTTDYLTGADELDARRFDALYESANDTLSNVAGRSGSASNSEFLVDLVDDDVRAPDLSMAESAFVDPDSGYNDLRPRRRLRLRRLMRTRRLMSPKTRCIYTTSKQAIYKIRVEPT